MESTASGFKAFSVLTFSWPVSQNLVNWVKMGKVIKMEGEGRTQARKIIRRKEKGVGRRRERLLGEKKKGYEAGEKDYWEKRKRCRTQAREIIRRKEKGVGGRCERILKEKRVGGRQENLLKGRRGRTQARRVI